MRLYFCKARGEEEKSTLVTSFRISYGDLLNRLGKTSKFPAESGSAPAPQADAVVPDLSWSSINLAFLSSPLLLNLICVCYIYCLLALFRERR